MSRGFFAIGIANGKTPANLGTLWRSASSYNAAFVFTLGTRYAKQASDTCATPFHKPLFHFDDVDDLIEHLPFSAPLVGVELDERSAPMGSFQHPDRAVYLLGAEDHGLTTEQRSHCHSLVQIETPNPWSLNVSVAGSLLMHDRMLKRAAS